MPKHSIFSNFEKWADRAPAWFLVMEEIRRCPPATGSSGVESLALDH
jgi:hypothetical protein